jgi:hypothetical protein
VTSTTVPVHPVETPPLAFTGVESQLQLIIVGLLLASGGLLMVGA